MTINSASMRLKIDRGVLTRMTFGIAPDLEVLERFARQMGLDVNRWRALAGYEPIKDTAMADELKHAKEQLSEAERILAEIVDVQHLHQARNPGAPLLDVEFFRDPDLPFAEKIRRFTVLRERIARGELD